jgi:inorganic pyrophosphatase
MLFTRQDSNATGNSAWSSSTKAVDSSIVAFASVRNKAATSDPAFGDCVVSEGGSKCKYAEDVVPAMIEVSRGSPNKYEIEKETGQLMLDRVLHSAVFYPGDYGYIPQTLCGDGDPLDILLVAAVDTAFSQKLAPGVIVNCRVLGYMDMEDEAGRDEKLIAVISNQKSTEHLLSLDDVPAHLKKEIHHFFENYKLLEMKKGKPKWARVLGWGDKQQALDLVESSRKMYHKKYGSGEKLHPFVRVPQCPNMLHVRQTRVQSAGEFVCYVNVSKGDMNSYLYRQDTTYRHYKYSLDMPYPGDYGWMCQTWQESCDKPVEVLILSTFAVEPESLVDVRIIGGLERSFKGKSGSDLIDLKIICVQKNDPRTMELTDITKLSPQSLKHIETIFQHSAEVSGGSDCKIVRKLNVADAISAAQKCHLHYLDVFTDKTIHNAPNLWCLPWLKESSQGPLEKRVYPAVVEAPKHCSNRYCFEPDSGVLKCLGPLKTATFYPANAGFIPQTVAEDGKPVDVLILSTIPLQSRCGVEIRIVGAAECIDEMGPDIKIIGVPKSEPRMKEWDGIETVPKHMRDEMVHFFNAYKDLDDDWKFCRFERWLDMDEAVKYVQTAHSRFFLFALPMQRLEKRVQELEGQNVKLKEQLGVGDATDEAKLKAKLAR